MSHWLNAETAIMFEQKGRSAGSVHTLLVYSARLKRHGFQHACWDSMHLMVPYMHLMILSHQCCGWMSAWPRVITSKWSLESPHDLLVSLDPGPALHDVHPEAPISAFFLGKSECLPFGCCWQWCIPAVDGFTFSNFLSFLEISIPNVDKKWQTFGFFWVFSSAGKTWKTMATQTPRWRSESHNRDGMVGAMSSKRGDSQV